MNGPQRLLLGLVFAQGCHASAPVRPDAALVLRVEGPASLCYIDDMAVQLHPSGTRVMLPSGAHRLEVRAPGFFTAYRDVHLPPRGRRELAIRLRADPDADLSPPLPRDPP